ncbi:MAG TPA: hypothetical protein ENJ19_05760 [Gammaproteobacteria bacterium]|nr:hypothetical protein [Gammaproteobacteria bacterium]
MIEHFEPLRNMEAFTEDMFNRIIDFQERKHPAWDESLSFAERIKGLPLHNLVFSNPDRDPARFGPTVAPYFPLRDEIRRIVAYARQVAEAPVFCDVHAGNGFIGSLIAQEEVNVIGVRDPSAKPNQIRDFYDRERYQMRETAIAAIDFAFDVAFSSWMPSGKNYTPEIVKHRPKLIVFVHTQHINEETGEPQTGVPEAFTDLPEHYTLIHEWGTIRPRDLFHEIWGDLTPSIEETRYTKVYTDVPYVDISVPDYLPPAHPYDWEKELEMALLALQAKEHLRAQGMI